jgi:uncharacterized protein (UPF0212 family)
MNISDAIARLDTLRKRHGDINVQADCPSCGKTFDCGLVVVAPEVVRLKEAATGGIVDALDEVRS